MSSKESAMECAESEGLLIVKCQVGAETLKGVDEIEYINNLHRGLVSMKTNGVVVLPKNISLIAVPRGTQVVYQEPNDNC